MQKLQFKIHIDAPASHVYDIMLGLSNRSTYEAWTHIFHPTSTYEGTWDKGSKILFLGTDENGKRGGMISEIAENIPGKFVSIRHYGIVDGDREVTTGAEVEKWAGGLENYRFVSVNSGTEVNVETDTTKDFVDYFEETWPNALKKLKAMCEQS